MSRGKKHIDTDSDPTTIRTQHLQNRS